MITEMQPNETLDGRLQIEGVISRSGMASIYKAKDLMTGQAGCGEGSPPTVRIRSGFVRAV